MGWRDNEEIVEAARDAAADFAGDLDGGPRTVEEAEYELGLPHRRRHRTSGAGRLIAEAHRERRLSARHAAEDPWAMPPAATIGGQL